MTVRQRFRRWSEAGIWEASPRPLPRRWPTTPATAWIRRRFAVMSRLPAQKGGRERDRIERMIGHLKINRAIAATRYDKLARSFLDALHIAAIRRCLRYATL